MLALFNFMIRPESSSRDTALSLAINQYCKPQHHPKKLVSLRLREIPFGHSLGLVRVSWLAS